MYFEPAILSIIVAIGLALLAQVALTIRSDARQSQAQADLTKTVAEFTKDTKRRFDSVDQIILGHTERLHTHGERIGYIEGRVNNCSEGKS